MGGIFINDSFSKFSRISIGLNLSALQKSAERLSSGLRINRASDDPAGLVISEKLRSQIGSLNQEIENTSASIHKYRAVSSTVTELRSKLTDLRSLAVGASNEAVNSEAAQQAYNQSAQDIVESFNAQVADADYNGQPTLDGSEHSLASVSTLPTLDLSSAEAAELSIEVIDSAIAELDSVQIDLGSTERNELQSSLRSLEITRQNLVAAESTIRDTDFAQEYASYVSSMIRSQLSLAVFSHSILQGESVLKLFGDV